MLGRLAAHSLFSPGGVCCSVQAGRSVSSRAVSAVGLVTNNAVAPCLVLIRSPLTCAAGQVTKTAYRILNTLYSLGPAPEPNITILWHDRMPEEFKK